VQETAVPDKGTMYRVRVGPYAKPEDMNRARNQLAQNGIQSTVVKIKDNPKN
jgi:cell division protein FtsN